MSTIFYEKERAEWLLENGFSSFMSYSDLLILAKYFKHMGKNRTQIRKSLLTFCIKYNPDFNDVLSRRIIDSVIESSQKYGLRVRFDVPITQIEIDTIKLLQDYKKEKIVFVMLVLAKYFRLNDMRLKKKVESKYDDRFYVNEKLTDIIKMAQISVQKQERQKIIHELTLSGLVEPTYNGDYRIMFADIESKPIFFVTNLNDIGSFYAFNCQKCGKALERKAKRHNLCDGCYSLARKEKENARLREHMREVRRK